MLSWTPHRLKDDGRSLKTTVEDRTAPFNLMRWFLVLSFVTIVLLSTVLAAVLSRFLTNAMLMRDSEITAQFLENLAHTRPIWSYFDQLQNYPIDPVAAAFFTSLFGRLVGKEDVIRANVYAIDRTIIWSSTETLIGTRFDTNPELERAIRGGIVTEINAIGDEDKTEHTEFDSELEGQRYIETYIPVWSHDPDSVIGVVEIYRLTDSLFRVIDSGVRLIWICTFVGGFLLYVILFGIIFKANSFIHRQEKRLIESESMAVIGEMTAIVAHSIRNPLASIRSSAELALVQNSESARKSAENIVRDTDRLSDWVKGFLQMAHDKGNGDALVNLNTITQHSLSELTSRGKFANVVLSSDFEPKLPLVNANSVTLEHVLKNLIVNALEAMPEGGRIHISTRNCALRDAVEIHISDTGPGLTEQQFRHSILPLPTTKEGGMGLGITLSSRAIQRMGGSLKLSNASGGGTLASIVLPTAHQ